VEQVVLLIERQQTADQQIVGLILSRSRQVQHPEILAIAIVVEMPIGIIHEDGFPIFYSQFLLRLPTRRANGLRESGAVFNEQTKLDLILIADLSGSASQALDWSGPRGIWEPGKVNVAIYSRDDSKLRNHQSKVAECTFEVIP